MQYIDDPINHVMQTNGLVEQEITGSDRTDKTINKMDKELSALRSEAINMASLPGEQQWSDTLSSNGNGTTTDDISNSKTSSSKTRSKSAGTKS